MRLTASPPAATAPAPGVPAPEPDRVTDAVVYLEPLAGEADGQPTSKAAGANGAKAGAAKGTSGGKTGAPKATAAAKPGKDVAKAAPRVATIGQVDHRFVPRVLPVEVGTIVRFENRDRVYHNVFSVSPVKKFDVGKYPPRHSRRVTFDKPGVVRLFCDIDPAMAGFVLVLPTSVFTQPDAAGAFLLPDLPAGDYTLKLWHPTLGLKERKVEIPADGEAVVELRL